MFHRIMNCNQFGQMMQSNKNVCVIAIGMSGTGKTTFVSKMQSLSKHVHCINLDPAVRVIPYKPFIDIRETHQYKKIMKQFKLGPNGAILTALNLYASQPERIVDLLKLKIKENQQSSNVFVVDIPGQIQVFTWSSSSMILTEAIGTLMPVKICYIVDAVRCQNPNIFLSNLLFAQSIQFRLSKYPFLLLLNKSDCGNSDILLEWMRDYEEFMKKLQQDPSYLATLSKSIVIHLSEFYQKMPVAKISAKTGFGFAEIEKYLELQFIQK